MRCWRTCTFSSRLHTPRHVCVWLAQSMPAHQLFADLLPSADRTGPALAALWGDLCTLCAINDVSAPHPCALATGAHSLSSGTVAGIAAVERERPVGETDRRSCPVTGGLETTIPQSCSNSRKTVFVVSLANTGNFNPPASSYSLCCTLAAWLLCSWPV